jgi:hypothetical protein
MPQNKVERYRRAIVDFDELDKALESFKSIDFGSQLASIRRALELAQSDAELEEEYGVYSYDGEKLN